MPPKIKFDRDTVVDAAFKIARRGGLDAVNARAVAAKLGCSTQPLFREFGSMDEIKLAVVSRALEVYRDYIANASALSDKPYKSTGLAYIKLAREDPEIFKLLFMCSRENSPGCQENDETLEGVLDLLVEKTGYSREKAREFHLRLWFYVHGIASMIATRYLSFSDEELDKLLTDGFTALRALYDNK